MLVGNKADLRDEREVPRADAEALANKFKMLYFESSAKTGDNIDNVVR